VGGVAGGGVAKGAAIKLFEEGASMVPTRKERSVIRERYHPLDKGA